MLVRELQVPRQDQDLELLNLPAPVRNLPPLLTTHQALQVSV